VKTVRAKDVYLLCAIALVQGVGWGGSRRLKEWAATSLGFLAYRISKSKRRRSEERLARAVGDRLGAEERQGIVKAAFREFWRESFSLVLSKREKMALGAVEVRGLDHLRTALEKGKGVILWESSHFGKRMLAKYVLCERGFALHQLHIETHIGGFPTDRDGGSVLRRHLKTHFFEKHERACVAEIIHLPWSDSLAFTRLLLRRLGKNAILCSSSDGTWGQKLLSIPFLGHQQPFATGMISLARMSGAAILPMFCFEGSQGAPCLIIERPLHLESPGDREDVFQEALTQYAHALESYVTRYPAQYRSWHLLGQLQQP
jgi:phosphatidylinositol dimannoside acyltransferase